MKYSKILGYLAVFLFLVFAVQGVSAAVISVPGDYPTIQSAINAANAGDVISVAAGTYNENLGINKNINLQGNNTDSTINGTVTISADSVIFNGFTVTNPLGNGLFSQDRNNLTISNNIFENIGTSLSSGTAQAIYIKSSNTNSSNIIIESNEIHNVGNPNTGSNKGIFIGDSTGIYLINNLQIQNNSISNVSAKTTTYATGGRGAYGILINHGTGLTGKTVTLQVLDNTISNLEGLWAHGIGLEGNTPNAIVQRNSIKDLIDYKTPSDATGIMIEDNLGADSVVIRDNNFEKNTIGFWLVNVVTEKTVNASYNYWGSANPNFTALVLGDVDYEPYLNLPPETTPNTPSALIEETDGNNNGYTALSVIKLILNAIGNLPDLFTISLNNLNWTAWAEWGHSNQVNVTIDLINSSIGGNSDNGNKTIYVKVKSYTDNENSTTSNDSIVLDRQTPLLTNVSITGAGIGFDAGLCSIMFYSFLLPKVIQ